MAQLGIAMVAESSAAAFDLQFELERDGYEPWLHPLPDQLLDHPAWIESQLRDMWTLLVLLTPDTHTDPALCFQYAFALGAGVPVIPLLVEPLDPLPPLATRDPIPLADSAAWKARLGTIAQAANARAIPMPVHAPQTVIDARQQIDSPDSSERLTAIAQIARSDHPAARELLIAATRCPIYADVRRAAVTALGETRDPAVIPLLVEALGDSIEAVTQAAIPALATFGTTAIPALHAAITGDDRWRRNGAVIALAKIDSPDTVPALIDALAVEHWYSSRAAAARLAQIGDERAIPALQTALDRDDPHLHALVEQALTALQG